MNTRYTSNGFYLDPTSAKFECPDCHQKTLVRYVNKEGNYLPASVGRCDREIKCCYHYKASEYFRDNNIDVSDVITETIEQATEFYKIDKMVIHRKRYHLSENVNLNTCPNNFVRYMVDILKIDPVILKEQMLKYNLFITEEKQRYQLHDFVDSPYYHLDPKREFTLEEKTELFNAYYRSYNYNNQRVQYFYVSATGEVRTAREIQYKRDFHRVKDTGTLIHHEFDNYSKSKRVKWCLFGEHLLVDSKDKRDIIICEAEKTAFVMSMYYPEYVWLSTGGLNGISPDFDYIRTDVINYFMPDSDIDLKGKSCADKWRKKIPSTIYYQTPYKVIDFHEYCTQSEIEEGFDILDLQLKDPDRVKQLMGSLSYFM